MTRIAQLVAVAIAVVLAACGEDPPPAPEFSPDAAAGLATLHDMARNGGMTDVTWADLVKELGTDLWPGKGEQDLDAFRARGHHANLALISGDVARRLSVDPGGRADLEKQDPTSLAIHDAWVKALSGGPKAYRAWIAGEGTALLNKHIEARRVVIPPH